MLISSYIAYLFLALIYNRVKKVDENVSLDSVLDAINEVRLQYLVAGKKVIKKLDSRNVEALNIAEKLDLISLS